MDSDEISARLLSTYQTALEESQGRSPAKTPAAAKPPPTPTSSARKRSDLYSKKMGELLLKGWKMLGENCPATGEVPLMQHPTNERKFSVAANKYLDEMPAAALWWRITETLAPTAAVPEPQQSVEHASDRALVEVLAAAHRNGDPLRLPAPQPDPVAIALTVPYVVTTLTANHDTPELAEAIAAAAARSDSVRYSNSMRWPPLRPFRWLMVSASMRMVSSSGRFCPVYSDGTTRYTSIGRESKRYDARTMKGGPSPS